MRLVNIADTATAPEPTRIAALAQTFTDRLVARSSPAVLSDDHAPIARLLGGHF